MKALKKYLALILAMMMCLSLTACGAADEETAEVTSEAEAADDAAVAEESEPAPAKESSSGFVGHWLYDNYALYIEIRDDNTWSAYSFHAEEKGKGTAELSGDTMTLHSSDGDDFDTYTLNGDNAMVDSAEDTLSRVDNIIFLPNPLFELGQTAHFPDKFQDVTVKYPIEMNVRERDDILYTLDFSAVMGEKMADNYSTILLTFQPITDYDPYLCNGSGQAKRAMEIMINNIFKQMYGPYLVKSIGTNFQDHGNYYSITGFMWLDGSIYENDIDQAVRGCMEVRYYGPTGYVLVGTTVSLESRIQDYYDICNQMMDSVEYNPGWSTAPKPVPAQPPANAKTTNKTTKKTSSGQTVETFYWYDSDGDIWYFNGYTSEFVGFGEHGYIDDDTGEYMEANDAGWADDDDVTYYDDYDPWSDPGDGDDAWSDPGDYSDAGDSYDDYSYDDYSYDFGDDDW